VSRADVYRCQLLPFSVHLSIGLNNFIFKKDNFSVNFWGGFEKQKKKM
jgi:hypothetical protein